jgi:hypothetical protein
MGSPSLMMISSGAAAGGAGAGGGGAAHHGTQPFLLDWSSLPSASKRPPSASCIGPPAL